MRVCWLGVETKFTSFDFTSATQTVLNLQRSRKTDLKKRCISAKLFFFKKRTLKRKFKFVIKKNTQETRHPEGESPEHCDGAPENVDILSYYTFI